MPKKSKDIASNSKSKKKQDSPAKTLHSLVESQERNIRGDFARLPADALIINDIYFEGVPATSVTVQNEADIEVTETLRTAAPHIQPKGRDAAMVTIQLIFKEGSEQTQTLRRLMGELLHCPFVFVENNKIRQTLFAPAARENSSVSTDSMAFVLHFGSLSISQKMLGAIILDLQLSEFNYKPFSNHFWYSSTISGIPVKFVEE